MDKEEQEKLIAYLKNHENIISLIEYSDRWDLEIVLIAKNLLEFDKIVLNICESFPDIILEKDKLEIIRRYNSNHLPALIKEKGHDMIPITHEQEVPVKLDETDINILKILTQDARTSTYEIGKQIGISPDTVSYRIKQLQKEKVIHDFTIQVNLSLLNYIWYTFSMELKMFDHKNEKKFEEFLSQNQNVLRSAKTLGGWDLLLYMVVENPLEFHGIIKRLKNVFSNVIRNYQTWVAYKEHMFNPMPKTLYKL